ncbi:type I phosphomannose isomerase catalytic subunit [Aquimarina sp. W85]|uniref:type I phosphomannose isomerase catalytic subunit n=1 Tax=Aquimarina rhodophyticola TaxID=3342246 RepID=UPI00366B1994
MINYPIKFEPILKEKIWGGNKLKNILNKKTKKQNIGESWEISDVDEHSTSVVANGILKGMSLKEMMQQFNQELMGKNNYKTFGNNFPLLIKFIDAQENLSIQVHPDDAIAGKRHNSFGKTEMWYVMQADTDANVIIGFEDHMDKDLYKYHLKNNSLEDVLHTESIKNGDCFFINPGEIHAIGAGALIAEIQQTSDITYRVYDYNRTDKQGNSRDLHNDMAFDVINYSKNDNYIMHYDKLINQSSTITECPYFTTNFVGVKNSFCKDYTQLDSFVIYMCTQGRATVTIDNITEVISQGETLLIPATASNAIITSDNAELLEVYIA